ncbi:alpha/beta hydrolase, partial [Pseudomonas syringae pv. tagetis]
MIRVIFLTLKSGALLAALSGCSPLTLRNTLNPAGPVDHVYD